MSLFDKVINIIACLILLGAFIGAHAAMVMWGDEPFPFNIPNAEPSK